MSELLKRGWDFDDELSDDELAIWYFAPSQAEIDDESTQAVTGICLTAAEDAEIVHLMFVGTVDDIRLTPDELFENIDAIEAYRVGERASRPEVPTAQQSSGGTSSWSLRTTPCAACARCS